MRRGTVSATTGSGKTLFALHCFQMVRAHDASVRLLVVVPTQALLDQWEVALTCDGHVSPTDIGTYSGDGRPSHARAVNVAVINSARELTRELTKDGNWMLIVDECHRAGSPENAKALDGSFVAVLGISATPRRQFDDGFERFVEPRLGPVIYEYDYASARRDGVISQFELHNIRFALTASETETYDRLSKRARQSAAIWKRTSDERHRVRLERLLRERAAVSVNARLRIPAALAALRQTRGKAIVFHERIEAAEAIASALNNQNRRATTYHSEVYGPTRRERLRLFRFGAFDTIVTCRSLDEGLNVPDAELAVIAASTSSTRQRIQRLGRVLRVSEQNKIAVVVTLYATDAEERLLKREAERLAEVAAVRWFSAQRGNA